MDAEEILFFSRRPRSQDVLPGLLAQNHPFLKVEAVSRFFEALARIAHKSYSAAVCVVDAPDEVAYVIRLRKMKADLPILMLTSIEDPAYHALGEQMGATLVVQNGTDSERTADILFTALQTITLARENRYAVRHTAELARDLRSLSRKNVELVTRGLGLAAAADRSTFVVLIVEEDASAAFDLGQRLMRVRLPPLLRSVPNIEEAVSYLKGLGRYADRAAHPLPSVIISDVGPDGRSGLDLLHFVRAHEACKHAGFILYTDSKRPPDLDSAALLGANFFLKKKEDAGELVDVIQSIYEHYVACKSGAPPP